MFSFFKNKAEHFFTTQEKQLITEAIKKAEKQTSGEVRLFIESKCIYVNAIDRAMEVFEMLDMHKTQDKNGVLVYIALKHKQIAIYADEGIYHKVGITFWNVTLKNIISSFSKEDYVEGIISVIHQIGDALQTHFPHYRNDINELPDDIVFGK